jgi:hypothetical protein
MGGDVTAVLRVDLPLVFFVTGDSEIAVSVVTMAPLRLLEGEGVASTVTVTARRVLGGEDSSELVVTMPPRLVLGGDDSTILFLAVTPRCLLEGTGEDNSAAAATSVPRFLLAGDAATSTTEVDFVPRVFLTDGDKVGGSFISSFATDSVFTFLFDLTVFLVSGGEDCNSTSASTTPLFPLVTRATGLAGLLGISKWTLFRGLAGEIDVPVDPTDISTSISGKRSSEFCTLFSFCLVFFDHGVGLPSAVSAFTMPRSSTFLLRLLLAFV